MKVEFRISKVPGLDELLLIVNDYILDMYNEGKKIAVLAQTQVARQLDDLLWQDGRESFVPHFCAVDAKDYNSYKSLPILITDNLFIISGFDALINIMDIAIDPSKTTISKLVEFVYQNEAALQNSRKKYVFYKKLGIEIENVRL